MPLTHSQIPVHECVCMCVCLRGVCPEFTACACVILHVRQFFVQCLCVRDRVVSLGGA